MTISKDAHGFRCESTAFYNLKYNQQYYVKTRANEITRQKSLSFLNLQSSFVAYFDIGRWGA